MADKRNKGKDILLNKVRKLPISSDIKFRRFFSDTTP